MGQSYECVTWYLHFMAGKSEFRYPGHVNILCLFTYGLPADNINLRMMHMFEILSM